MITIPEKYADIMAAKTLGYVATIGPKGTPHVSPIWFYWDGRQIFFSTTWARQKSQNVKRNSGVSIAITDPNNPHRSLEIRGNATVEDDQEFRVAKQVMHKYTGQDPSAEQLAADEGRVTVAITPEKLLVFEI